MNHTDSGARHTTLLRDALVEIRKLRNELELSKEEKNGAIAVVGIGCRFPGDANDLESYWSVLKNGIDAITEIPENRWAYQNYYDSSQDSPGKMYTRWGGFIKDIDKFDADLFGISPREASAMDPQQRLLLEVSWEALEDAGLPPMSLSGSRTGLFVGLSFEDYAHLSFGHQDRRDWDAYTALGTARSIAIGRVAYQFGFQGPAIQVDTSCSSSLVAVHLACQSLRSGESSVALAGGVNAILSPSATIAFCRMRALSPDGRCRTFDASAAGYGRGEGCGIIVLKRLKDAISDGSRIWGIIRGSALNHDGRSNGLTAPNGLAQQAVIRSAWNNARLSLNDAGYMEVHGTGTILGDPIEVNSLATVIGANGGRMTPLPIGSVKTNIGHLESAAGIAGIIKIILSMKNGAIPPHLHFHSPNPNIPWSKMPFQVPTILTPWPELKGPRIAGISSFGMSGTNAHIVLEQAPALEITHPKASPGVHLLTLSSRTELSLKDSAANTIKFLRESKTDVSSICYTANAGRSHFDYRLSAMGASHDELAANLERNLAEQISSKSLHRHPASLKRQPKVIFFFSGEMNRFSSVSEIFEKHPFFRKTLEQCDNILKNVLRSSIIPLLVSKASPSNSLSDSAITIPAVFALQYSIAQLWQHWGISPEGVAGYGLGYFSAGCVAGAFTLEEGLLAVAQFSKWIQTPQINGSSILVYGKTEQIKHLQTKYHGSILISEFANDSFAEISEVNKGSEEILYELKSLGLKSIITGQTFTLRAEKNTPIQDQLKPIHDIHHYPIRFPIILNTTGDWRHAGDHLGHEDFIAQLLQGYHINKASIRLLNLEDTTLIECGVNSALLEIAHDYNKANSSLSPTSDRLTSVSPNMPTWLSTLKTLSKLYLSGFKIDWTNFHEGSLQHIVDFPKYSFQRDHYWLKERNKLFDVDSGDQEWPAITKASSDYLTSITPPEKVKLDALNNLSIGYIAEAIRQLNVFSTPSQSLSLEEINKRISAGKSSPKLIGLWMRHLLAAGKVREHQGRYIATESLYDNRIIPLKSQASLRWKSEPTLFQLVTSCGQSLAKVLRSEIDPITLLFPNGTSDVLEKVYRDSTIAVFYNKIISFLTERILSHSRIKPIRILEIGAGTGGTTSWLLKSLPAGSYEYTFTDVGKSFIQQGQDKFKSFPTVTFKALDIERAPNEQGFSTGYYDVIVASNVIHATKRIAEALRHIESLLCPNGYLLLWEATEPKPWLDITFALLSGWQRFEDSNLRPTHPLLSVSSWQEALRSQGFFQIATFPTQDPDTCIGQAVILARKANTSLPQEKHQITMPSCLKSNAPSSKDLSTIAYSLNWHSVDSDSKFLNTRRPGVWIIVSSDPSKLTELGDLLSNKGHVVLLLNDIFSPDAERIFAQLHSDYAFLPLHGIIVLSFLNALSVESKSGRKIQEHLNSECKIVLETLRRLTSMPLTCEHSSKLWLITCGAQSVNSKQSTTNPIATALWGMGRALAVEFPTRLGGLIDIDPSSFNTLNEQVTRILLNSTPQPEIAIRAGVYYQPRLEPESLHIPDRFALSPNHTYLITGGLGGIGKKIAHWVIQNGGRHLLLVGRKELPERKYWKEVLEEANSPHHLTVGEILKLEQAGASIRYSPADLSQKEDVEKLFQRADQEAWPPIRGIFHTAGTFRDQFALELSEDDLTDVFSPKVAGTWDLIHLAPKESLEFAIFCSSATSLLGSLGGANYAAANAFLDGLALDSSRRGLRVSSICWGPWDNLGMSDQDRQARLGKHGIQALDHSTALSALAGVISKGAAHVAIIAADWKTYCNSVDQHHSGMLATLMRENGISLSQPAVQTEVPGQNSAVHQIKKTVSEAIMKPVDAIDSLRTLNSLGVDSIMAIQIKNEIEAQFRIIIPITKIVESTVAELANFLNEEGHHPK